MNTKGPACMSPLLHMVTGPRSGSGMERRQGWASGFCAARIGELEAQTAIFMSIFLWHL